jgi:hypothetical protein
MEENISFFFYPIAPTPGSSRPRSSPVAPRPVPFWHRRLGSAGRPPPPHPELTGRRPPQHSALSGRPPPQIPHPRSPCSSLDWNRSRPGVQPTPPEDCVGGLPHPRTPQVALLLHGFLPYRQRAYKVHPSPVPLRDGLMDA